MKNIIRTGLFFYLLLVVGWVAGNAQTSSPQYYTGDTAPTKEILSQSYIRYFGNPANYLVIIGVHKVNDTEYLILTTDPEKTGIPPSGTTLRNLWKLESKEWVTTDPYSKTVRYIKVLINDKP